MTLRKGPRPRQTGLTSPMNIGREQTARAAGKERTPRRSVRYTGNTEQFCLDHRRLSGRCADRLCRRQRIPPPQVAKEVIKGQQSFSLCFLQTYGLRRPEIHFSLPSNEAPLYASGGASFFCPGEGLQTGERTGMMGKRGESYAEHSGQDHCHPYPQ